MVKSSIVAFKKGQENYHTKVEDAFDQPLPKCDSKYDSIFSD